MLRPGKVTRIPAGHREDTFTCSHIVCSGMESIRALRIVCASVQRAKEREPLVPHETPSHAWQIVGTDLFFINHDTYLLVSDYYSKFPFVDVIPSPVTSAAVIAKTTALCRAWRTTTCDQRQWRSLQLWCIDEVR